MHKFALINLNIYIYLIYVYMFDTYICFLYRKNQYFLIHLLLSTMEYLSYKPVQISHINDLTIITIILLVQNDTSQFQIQQYQLIQIPVKSDISQNRYQSFPILVKFR